MKFLIAIALTFSSLAASAAEMHCSFYVGEGLSKAVIVDLNEQSKTNVTLGDYTFSAFSLSNSSTGSEMAVIGMVTIKNDRTGTSVSANGMQQPFAGAQLEEKGRSEPIAASCLIFK